MGKNGGWYERMLADPEWIAAEKKRQAQRDARDKMLRENEAPIVRDLRAAGYDVESAWDLRVLEVPYPKAIPVLLHHMRKYTEYDHRIREGMALALNLEETVPVLPELLSIYREDPDASLLGKAVLGRTIAELAEKKYMDEILELALDPKHGVGRCALVEWLGQWDNEEVQSALQQLATDDAIEIYGRAEAALKGGYRNLRKRRRRKESKSMSYDLTIAKDLTFSEATSFAKLAAFISRSAEVITNGDRGFIYSPVQHLDMEIDLEVVSEEGDSIAEPGTSYPEINCISLHITAQEQDDLEETCFPFAKSVADRLGWTVFDDQTGEPLIDPDEPWWKFW